MGRGDVSTERDVLSEIVCGDVRTSARGGGNVFRAAAVLRVPGWVQTQGVGQGECCDDRGSDKVLLLMTLSKHGVALFL